jgi:hypothetical protein
MCGAEDFWPQHIQHPDLFVEADGQQLMKGCPPVMRTDSGCGRRWVVQVQGTHGAVLVERRRLAAWDRGLVEQDDVVPGRYAGDSSQQPNDPAASY